MNPGEIAYKWNVAAKEARYGISADHEFFPDFFLENFASLSLTDIGDENAQRAFWLNIYNGFLSYFLWRGKIKQSLRRSVLVFRRRLIRIDRWKWSLDEIEHGILRGNQKAPYALFPPFSRKDERKKFALPLDSRIHFALNCGAVSCPPVRAYTAENLDRELDLARQSYLSQEFIVDHQAKRIRCSSLLCKYAMDFPGQFTQDPAFTEYHFQLLEFNGDIL